MYIILPNVHANVSQVRIICTLSVKLNVLYNVHHNVHCNVQHAFSNVQSIFIKLEYNVHLCVHHNVHYNVLLWSSHCTLSVKLNVL